MIFFFFTKLEPVKVYFAEYFCQSFFEIEVQTENVFSMKQFLSFPFGLSHNKHGQAERLISAKVVSDALPV